MKNVAAKKLKKKKKDGVQGHPMSETQTCPSLNLRPFQPHQAIKDRDPHFKISEYDKMQSYPNGGPR